MQKDKIIVAIFFCFCLTLLAIWKRSFTYDSEHDFTLEFGGSLLSPNFRFFSVFSALLITFFFNHVVGREIYRDVSGWYEKRAENRRFLREKNIYLAKLKNKPIKTLRVSNYQQLVKYLQIPEYFARFLVENFRRMVLFFGLSCMLTVVLIISVLFLWTKN